MVLNDAISTFRNAINERHDANWPKIQAADDITGIHLDYIESKESNAFAFYVDDLACIAITEAAVNRVLHITQSMAVTPGIWAQLGIGKPDDLSRLASALFSTIMQVLTSHETGHIFHGHCYETARSLPLVEAAENAAPCFTYNVENSLRLQAMEVEADGYCAHMLIKNLFDGIMGKSLADFLATKLPEEEFIMTFLLLAIGGLFYLWAPGTFDEQRVDHCDHPFALMRMNVFMTDIKGWCEVNHPSLINWGTVKRFQAIMNAVESSDTQQASRDIWDRQGAYLLSTPGEAYKSRLYSKRENLRSEMIPHQWHLVSPEMEVA